MVTTITNIALIKIKNSKAKLYCKFLASYNFASFLRKKLKLHHCNHRLHVFIINYNKYQQISINKTIWSFTCICEMVTVTSS